MNGDDVFWLKRPCPAWCVATHGSDDELEHRRHESDELCSVPLASMVNRCSDRPLLATVYLGQGYREVGPLVYFIASRQIDVVFTLEEAEQVGTAFLTAVRRGKEADHAPAQ